MMIIGSNIRILVTRCCVTRMMAQYIKFKAEAKEKAPVKTN